MKIEYSRGKEKQRPQGEGATTIHRRSLGVEERFYFTGEKERVQLL